MSSQNGQWVIISEYHQLYPFIIPVSSMLLADSADGTTRTELMNRSQKSKRRLRRKLVFHLSSNVWSSQVKPCKSQLSYVQIYLSASYFSNSLHSLEWEETERGIRLERAWLTNRGDDKKIEEFKLVGGSVIHLVLALRGGSLWLWSPNIRGMKDIGRVGCEENMDMWHCMSQNRMTIRYSG